MEVDSSENQNMGMAPKSDNQSNGSNSATPSKRSYDDKKDIIEGNSAKSDNVGNEDINEKSPTSDGASTLSHQTTKSEFPFRETFSSAITDSNNQMIDNISTATESSTVLTSEIKQEGSCNSPDAPLLPYAVSKIQVSSWKKSELHLVVVFPIQFIIYSKR